MIKQDHNSFFITNEEGKIVAKMKYSDSAKIIIIASTFVDASLRGQGVGKKLLDEVMKMARDQNKKNLAVMSLC